MKKLLTVLSLILFTSSTYAAENSSPQPKAKAANVKHKAKTAKVEEKACKENDQDCLLKTTTNPNNETVYYMKEKSEEIGNVDEMNSTVQSY